MAITLDGTSGITTPGVTNSGNETVTGTLTAASFNAASTFGFKNRIINGAMQIDQRNAGASVNVASGAGNIYTVDRWAGVTSGGTVAYQRVSGIGNYQNAIQLTGGASVTQAQLFQRIESYNIADCASQTVTVSFTAKSTTLTTLNVLLVYPTAGQDNWSSGYTNISTATITINSTATGYSANFSLPSNVTNGLGVIFYTGSFTSGTLTITGVQLEKGSTATSFDYRPYGTELALCQRYLPSVLGATNHFPAMAYSGNGCLAMIPFPVTARTAPTGITVSSVSGFIAWRSNSANAGNPSSISFNAGGQYTGVVDVAGFTAGVFTAGNMTTLQFNSSTGYLLFTGCEL